MRLEEIVGGDAAEMRVKRLKDNAKRAKEHAKRLKANADLNAERLKLKKTRQTMSKLHSQSSLGVIRSFS